MPRKIATHPDTPPNEGADFAPAPVAEMAESAPSMVSEPEPDFRPIDGNTPLGQVIRVRGADLPETQAIRSRIVGWYAPGFSHVLAIKPTEWAPAH